MFRFLHLLSQASGSAHQNCACSNHGSHSLNYNAIQYKKQANKVNKLTALSQSFINITQIHSNNKKILINLNVFIEIIRVKINQVDELSDLLLISVVYDLVSQIDCVLQELLKFDFVLRQLAVTGMLEVWLVFCLGPVVGF